MNTQKYNEQFILKVLRAIKNPSFYERDKDYNPRFHLCGNSGGIIDPEWENCCDLDSTKKAYSNSKLFYELNQWFDLLKIDDKSFLVTYEPIDNNTLILGFISNNKIERYTINNLSLFKELSNKYYPLIDDIIEEELNLINTNLIRNNEKDIKDPYIKSFIKKYNIEIATNPNI